MRTFQDRTEAGRELADAVAALDLEDPIVLGLPRGGVPVAAEVATAIGAPLDVLVVRKIGAPGHEEYGIGAIGEGGVEVLEQEPMRRLGLTRSSVTPTIEREREELRRRVERYRGGQPRIDITDRVVVVVDDGLATGVSATAAIRVLREHRPARIVLAVPVGAPQSVERLRQEVDELVCLHAPPGFAAVGSFYRDFTQTTDRDVIDLLSSVAESLAPSGPGRVEGAAPSAGDEGFGGEVDVVAGEVTLPGILTVPRGATGVVVFAHGSGSSRHSPRNQHVADRLHAAGLGTLLFDLLTTAEERDRANVFDIELLGERLTAAVRWLRQQDAAAGLPTALFGASTGAAAALAAAVSLHDVAAVVSRGGRPDLAPKLSAVEVPTLLIVGGADTDVLRLNQRAAEQMAREPEVVVVEGAGHLFEGPGELDEVADLAAAFLRRHLAG